MSDVAPRLSPRELEIVAMLKRYKGGVTARDLAPALKAIPHGIAAELTVLRRKGVARSHNDPKHQGSVWEAIL